MNVCLVDQTFRNIANNPRAGLYSKMGGPKVGKGFHGDALGGSGEHVAWVIGQGVDPLETDGDFSDGELSFRQRDHLLVKGSFQRKRVHESGLGSASSFEVTLKCLGCLKISFDMAAGDRQKAFEEIVHPFLRDEGLKIKMSPRHICVNRILGILITQGYLALKSFGISGL